MLQRLRQRRLLDIPAGPGPERSARCGDDDAHQFLPVTGAKRLKQRVVLGIGGQDAGASGHGTLHEEIARTNQAFLVGERNRRTAIHRGECRLQSGRAADRGHDPIGRTGRRLDDRTLARPAFGAGAGQRVLQIAEQAWVGDGGKARVELLRKLRQIPDIAVGGQRLDPISIGSGSQQIHRAVADRPGGSQDGHGPDGGCRGFVVTQGNGAHRLTKP